MNPWGILIILIGAILLLVGITGHANKLLGSL